jgi:integrase
VSKRGRGRRAHGEGSIFRRSSDGRWCAQLDLGMVNGKRRTVRRYAKTEQEALAKLRELHSEYAGQRLDLDRTRLRVGEYLEYWLTELLPGTVKPSTQASYADLTRRHLIPALGHIQLAKLSKDDVRRFLRDKANGHRIHAKTFGNGVVARRTGAPLSGRTVHYLHAILRRALEDARREDLIARNVAREVKPVRYERKEFQPLTPAEARKLLAAAEGDRLYPLYVLALLLGLRRGELLGLRWSAIDLDAGTLRVKDSLQRVGGELRFTGTKTHRSRRTIPLPKVCVDVLKQHRQRQAAQRAEAEEWADPDLVFTTARGTPLEPQNVYRHFKALCAAAGVRAVRFHDLRHSCASLLFELGVPLRVIMEILGHTQITTTSEIYTHILPTQYREVAVALDGWFTGADLRIDPTGAG